jgi:Rrf2 family protein
MKLSKKSRYGIIALIDLSIHSENSHVALNSIAERNEISPQYLEQVFAGLRRSNIVKSIKGPQGGYLLSDDASKITVASILMALEGTYRIEAEEISDESAGASAVIQEQVVDRINRQLDEVLEAITLEDLVNDYRSRNEESANMYYI